MRMQLPLPVPPVLYRISLWVRLVVNQMLLHAGRFMLLLSLFHYIILVVINRKIIYRWSCVSDNVDVIEDECIQVPSGGQWRLPRPTPRGDQKGLQRARRWRHDSDTLGRIPRQPRCSQTTLRQRVCLQRHPVVIDGLPHLSLTHEIRFFLIWSCWCALDLFMGDWRKVIFKK